MQIHHVGYRIRGFYRLAALGHLWDMTPKDAHRRLEILRFFDKHGLAATRDAFGVSRRTLYRWKATLKAQGGNPAALAAQFCAPRKRRVPKTDPRRALPSHDPGVLRGRPRGLALHRPCALQPQAR
jgi:hypothetical protein